ncbi:uncharacterized protein LOC144755921 [Lissotriton helveticus]
MERKTVRVDGIPTNIPIEKLKDKLTIHFLRSRNGSAEIEDIDIQPGPPACALITFEDAKAAQRVLSVKDHICSVNGNTYRLKVTSHTPVLNPDEVFVKMSVVVDSKRFSGDLKKCLRRLQKHHKDVEFRFVGKEEFCCIEGAYTKLLAISNDILKSLDHSYTNEKETQPSTTQGSGQSETNTMKDFRGLKPEVNATLQSKPTDQSLKYGSESEGHSRSFENKSQKLADIDDINALESLSVKENTVNHLDDFSLVMDSDIYKYINTFKKTEYQRILHRYKIEAVDVSNDDITTVYLQAGSQMRGGIETLTEAHFELLQLYMGLEITLRKEQASKTDIKCDKKALETLPTDLQKMCPLLLCHEDEHNFYFIGNVVDVSQAKQYIQELEITTTLKYPFTAPDPLLSTSAVGRQRINSGGLLEAKQYMPRQSSCTKLESKSEQKLAANFSIPKSSSLEKGYQLDRDIKVMEQKYLFGDKQPSSLCSLSTSTEMKAATRQAVSDLKCSKDGDRSTGFPYSKRFDSLPLVGRDKDILQSTKKSEHAGPMKVYSHTSLSSSLAGLSLLDSTKTASFIDHKPSQHGSTLRRSNSFSAPKTNETDISDTHPKTMRAELKDFDTEKSYQVVDAEISVDNWIWAYVKDVYHSYIIEICSGGEVQISEKKAKDITVLKLTSVDKAKLDVAKQNLESLYHRKSTNVMYRFFNYHQLGVEGPGDETLAEWCHVFQSCSDKVRVSKDNSKLHLTYPKDIHQKISEKYNICFEKQLRLQSLPSMLKVTDDYMTKERFGHIENALERDILPSSNYNNNKYDLQHNSDFHTGKSERFSDVANVEQSKELETMEGPNSNEQWSQDIARNNDHLQALDVEQNMSYQIKSQVHTESVPENVADVPSIYPQLAEFSHQNLLEQEMAAHAHALVDGQMTNKQAADAENLKGPLPDKCHLSTKSTEGGANDDPESHPLPFSVVPQSLPVGLYGTQQNSTPLKTGNEQPTVGSILIPEGQTQEHNLGTVSNGSATKAHSRRLNVDHQTDQSTATKCDQCKKENTSLHKGPCGHNLCRNCYSSSETCRVCLGLSSTSSESVIKGTMSCTTMAMSLSGYNHDPSFKIIYDISDGMQGPKDPNPGKPYKGGRFEAFLPDNKEGQRILLLLKKAFDQGHTFKIHSRNSEDRVTWNSISHKTAINGGRNKSGYPDSNYLKTVHKQLKALGIE